MQLEIKILIASFLAWLIAQLIKKTIFVVKNKKFDAKIIFGSGGMPSSHSSTMAALTTSIYIIQGLSIPFTISLILTIIIMKDAVGVRNEVSKHAKILNKILSEKKLKPSLNESVGHNLSEVIIGAFVGMFISMIVFSI